MNSKQIYSRYFNEYTLDKKQRRKLQIIELKMLHDFNNACQKYNIKYMLSGGSVLGAIRHNGFIPWDDDIDIIMYRSEYEKVDAAMAEMYGDKYTIISGDIDKNYICKFKKILLNDTKYVEIEAENYPYQKSIFIDIFPIDNIPNSKISCKIRGIIHDFAFLATGAICFAKYPSNIIKQKAKKEKEIKKFYNTKMAIGKILSVFFGFQFYMNIEKKLANYKKKTNFEGIPTAIRYNREVFESGFFSETILHEFEGEMFPIPANYDRYLKNLYGDYMQIPPVEKREMHSASLLDFGKYGDKDE